MGDVEELEFEPTIGAYSNIKLKDCVGLDWIADWSYDPYQHHFLCIWYEPTHDDREGEEIDVYKQTEPQKRMKHYVVQRPLPPAAYKYHIIDYDRFPKCDGKSCFSSEGVLKRPHADYCGWGSDSFCGWNHEGGGFCMKTCWEECDWHMPHPRGGPGSFCNCIGPRNKRPHNERCIYRNTAEAPCEAYCRSRLPTLQEQCWAVVDKMSMAEQKRLPMYMWKVYQYTDQARHSSNIKQCKAVHKMYDERRKLEEVQKEKKDLQLRKRTRSITTKLTRISWKERDARFHLEHAELMADYCSKCRRFKTPDVWVDGCRINKPDHQSCDCPGKNPSWFADS